VADLLIVDDDIDSTAALAEIMRAQGHHVRIAYNGEEGLRLAHALIPQIVLLDVEMPILGGPGMAYEMLLHNMGLEKVPVVLLSGVSNLNEVAARVGTPYFLGKPYRAERLVALVSRALSERIAPRPAEKPT
jgi:DNA-binding NtrC family response regulator